MKPLHLTLVCLLCACTSLFAQVQKGAIYLPPTQIFSGSFGIASDKFSANLLSKNDQSSLNLTFLTAGGYALSDHFLVWGVSAFSTSSVMATSYSRLGLSLNARYYLNPEATNSNFFIELGGNTDLELVPDGQKRWGYQAALGLSHFISPSLALEVGAGRQQTGEQASFALYTGLAIYLNKERNAYLTSINPFRKGTWMLGTGLMKLRFPEVANQQRDLNLSPQVAYFVADRFAAGLSFNYNDSNLEGVKSTYWTLEPHLRYYYRIRAKAGLFLTAGAGPYGSKIEQGDYTESQSGFFYGLGMGTNVLITPSLAVEVGPNFRHYTHSNLTRMGLDLGIRMFL